MPVSDTTARSVSMVSTMMTVAFLTLAAARVHDSGTIPDLAVLSAPARSPLRRATPLDVLQKTCSPAFLSVEHPLVPEAIAFGW